MIPTLEQVEQTISDTLRSGSIHDAAENVMLLFSPQSESDARNAAINDIMDRTAGKPADLVKAIAAVDRTPKQTLRALSDQFAELSKFHGTTSPKTRELFAGLASAFYEVSK